MADYADQTIRLADLAQTAWTLEDLEFERCEILGPAVITPSNCTFLNCSFGVLNDEPASLAWEISPDHPMQGTIALERCSFTDCKFLRTGVGLLREDIEDFLSGLVSAQEPPATAASLGSKTPVAS